jgi:hypothetical protein
MKARTSLIGLVRGFAMKLSAVAIMYFGFEDSFRLVGISRSDLKMVSKVRD